MQKTHLYIRIPCKFNGSFIEPRSKTVIHQHSIQSFLFPQDNSTLPFICMFFDVVKTCTAVPQTSFLLGKALFWLKKGCEQTTIRYLHRDNSVFWLINDSIATPTLKHMFFNSLKLFTMCIPDCCHLMDNSDLFQAVFNILFKWFISTCLFCFFFLVVF